MVWKILREMRLGALCVALCMARKFAFVTGFQSRFGLRHEVGESGEGGVVEGRLDVEHLDVLVEQFAHAVYGGVHGRVGRVHQGAGVREHVGGVMVADRGVRGEARVDGLVPAVHGDEVDVHVHQQVALGDAAVDRHLLALFRLADSDVVLLVLGVVVVEAVGVVLGHYLVAKTVSELGLGHPAVQAEGRDQVYVLDALRVGLFQHLLDHELPRVGPLHGRERQREVVEGDSKLHPGEEQFV